MTDNSITESQDLELAALPDKIIEAIKYFVPGDWELWWRETLKWKNRWAGCIIQMIADGVETIHGPLNVWVRATVMPRQISSKINTWNTETGHPELIFSVNVHYRLKTRYEYPLHTPTEIGKAVRKILDQAGGEGGGAPEPEPEPDPTTDVPTPEPSLVTASVKQAIDGLLG